MNRALGRFPFAPVQRELEDRFELITDPDRSYQFLDAGDNGRASTLLGYDRRTIGQWRNGRLLTVTAADRCAIALGLHPLDLWPDWDDICNSLDDARAAAYQRRIDKQRQACAARRALNTQQQVAS